MAAKAEEEKQPKTLKEKLAAVKTNAVEGVKQWWKDLRIGDGHWSAWNRLALKELRNALEAFPQSITDTEIGLFGTAVQSEVASARKEKAAATTQAREGTVTQQESVTKEETAANEPTKPAKETTVHHSPQDHEESQAQDHSQEQTLAQKLEAASKEMESREQPQQEQDLSHGR